MELLKITPTESKLWEQVWRLYTESFPEWERRRISSHSRATEDVGFHTYIALENGNLLGLLFYWEYDKTIYLEHIAVNPAMRGKSIGSNIIRELIDKYPGYSLLLEVDPPIDEISQRRVKFYERLGFVMNDYPYMHPSYSTNGKAHELRIMSFPTAISNDKFEEFRNYIKTKVIKYID